MAGVDRLRFTATNDAGAAPIDITFTPTVEQIESGTLSGTGLAAITSGKTTASLIAIRGGDAALYSAPSNTVVHGDVIAPTITSGFALTAAEEASASFLLTASETVTYAVVGGVNANAFSISGTNLLMSAQDFEAGPTRVVQVQAIDLAGNTSAVQTITVTLNDIDEMPDSYSFTSIPSGATISTVYTGNTITVSGLGGSVSVPVTVTGGSYSKNGGAFTSAPGTATNGDTITPRLTTGTNNEAYAAVIKIGEGTASYLVTVGAAATWDSANKTPGMALTNGDLTATGTGTGQNVMLTKGPSTGRFYVEVVPVTRASQMVLAFGNARSPFPPIYFVNNGYYATGAGFEGFGGPTFGVGTPIAFAVDADTNTIWPRLGSGGWFAGDPEAGGAGISVADVGAFHLMLEAINGDSATVNAGATAFSHPKPASFPALKDL